MYLSIIFLPLIGAFIAGFFGRFLGKQGAILITTALVFLSSIFSFIVFILGESIGVWLINNKLNIIKAHVNNCIFKFNKENKNTFNLLILQSSHLYF